MKTSFPEKGIIVALSLPFDRNGNLMIAALGDHLNWLKACGIHGILALGSKGEFPLLSLDQREAMPEAAHRLADPLPVLANTTDMRAEVTAELGKFARELVLPGVAIMPPLFYPSSEDEQLAWFEFAHPFPN